MNWHNQLASLPLDVLCDEPLGRWTTLRIGGPADALVRVSSVKALCQLVLLARGEPVLLLGRGSNLLVSDAGFRGLVVVLQGEFGEIRLHDGVIEAGAGVALPRLSKFAAKNGLSGLEFAMGVPGSVGGGLMMNAGAWQQQLSDTVQAVEVVTHVGEQQVLTAEQAQFSYRRSRLGEFFAITRAWFTGTPCASELVTQQMQALYERKTASQPFTEQNAGCMFKNPPGDSAGRLIDVCGLKGKRVGGLEVSQKHANFIVNHGTGTATDLLKLIHEIQQTVDEETGHLLELEVRLVGFPTT